MSSVSIIVEINDGPVVVHFDYRRNQAWGQAMGTRTATVGALFATMTALAWGGQFVVGKSALGT